MTAASDDMKELDELLQRMCDSCLDAVAAARLAEILASSKAAQRRYIEYMDYCIGIAHALPGIDENDRLLPRQSASTILPFDAPRYPPSSAADPTPMLSVAVNDRTRLSRKQTISIPRFSLLRSLLYPMTRAPLRMWAAAVLLLCLLGAPWMLRALRPVVVQPAPVESLTADAANLESDFAARIIGMTSDTTWENPGAKVDALLRFKTHETIHVLTGLVRIEFVSGAKVILQAPAVFTPTGPDSGQLDRGRLTGKATNGNFRLTTKAAEVIDLGTEFGVAVDDVTGTDVLVFDGEVEVVPRAAGPDAGRVLKMTEGMAARITPTGSAVHDFPAEPGGFSRSITSLGNRDKDNELSLVDVICGGNGFDNNLAGAIDPRTGKPDSGVWLRSWGAGRRKGAAFNLITHCPPLDAVFIPFIGGEATQVDSLGNKIVLPCFTSQTFGPIWARRSTKGLDTAGEGIDFWGPDTFKDVNQRLQSTRHGVIGLQANVGFTVDLQAVRMRQHCDVTGFEAVIALLAAYKDRQQRDPAKTLVDFRVYVDGVLRTSRLSIKRADGDIRVAVSLTPVDQRITLVSTDADESILFDELVLIDPILMLDRSTRSQSSE